MSRIIVTAFLAVACFVVFVTEARRNRLVLTVVSVSAFLGGIWLAVLIAVEARWKDADGFVDCSPTCTRYQDAIGAVLFGAPAVLVALLGAAALLGLRRRRRD